MFLWAIKLNSHSRLFVVIVIVVVVVVQMNSNFAVIAGIQFANVGQKYGLSLYWATATATSTG